MRALSRDPQPGSVVSPPAPDAGAAVYDAARRRPTLPPPSGIASPAAVQSALDVPPDDRFLAPPPAPMPTPAALPQSPHHGPGASTPRPPGVAAPPSGAT